MKKKVDPTAHLQNWKIVAANPDPAHGLYWQSMLTLGNGFLGVRGAREEEVAGKNSLPMTLVAEVFDRPPRIKGEPAKFRRPIRLAPAPNWLGIVFNDGDGAMPARGGKVMEETLTLDMQRGVLVRELRYKGKGGKITRIVSRRIVSQARPHIAAIQYDITPENYSGRVRLTSSLDGNVTYPDGLNQTTEQDNGSDGEILWLSVRTNQSKIVIAEAARHSLSSDIAPLDARVTDRLDDKKAALTMSFEIAKGQTARLEKVVAINNSLHHAEVLTDVVTEASEAPEFTKLAAENAAVWAGYWRDSDVKITGDRFVQTMARFFVYQILQAASLNNVRLGLSTSIGAKTMSGWGYDGRVFWDTEIYMLPFFSQQYPELAKSLLQYRYDRLEGAARNAKAMRCGGLKFPWEGADTGLEECPKWLPRKDGSFGRWRGAEQELHIDADVSFGYWQHFLTTGDDALLMGQGLDILLGTARFWGDRVSKKVVKGQKVYEIKKVIGPDEYHHTINNSVYTNAMARWNLTKAIELLAVLKKRKPSLYSEAVKRNTVTAKELAHWQDVADHLKINFDPQTGLYEQFDGYFQHERKQIKQADVLLMLHLLPEMRTKEIFRRNFDLYHPVTLHGSSLSPGVHVLFALDVGYHEKAYEYELQSCSIDGIREDGGTDAGLHAASLGGGWSSIVAGFGGVRVMPDCLRVAPELPRKWKRLEFSIQYRSLRLRFDITPGKVIIVADPTGPTVTLDLLGERTKISAGQKIERKL